MLVKKAERIILLDVLKKYGSIELPAAGVSMYPVIKDGDICSFTICDPNNLTSKDIVLFMSDQGKLVAHRFYKTTTKNNIPQFIFKGDTNLGTDTPIPKEFILGKLHYIKRGSKRIYSNSLPFFAWRKVIQLFPQVGYLVKKIKQTHLQKRGILMK
jgi:signal peptidase I